MDSPRLEQLVTRLRELDNQSIRYYDAKQTLLSEGYSEAEITTATYTFPYDGRPNRVVLPKQLLGEATDLGGDIEPDTSMYGQSAAKTPTPITPAESTPSDGKLEVLNYVILRLVVALCVLGNILAFMLRPYPWPHQAYPVEYWLAGVMVAVPLLAMASRKLKLTRKNGIVIGLGFAAAIGLFIHARQDEYIAKNYTSQKCLQILRSATAESDATGGLPPPNLGLPADCLETQQWHF